MTLEQRLAAVEAELAEMKSQQLATEEISKLMREVCTSVIKSAKRPGGMIYHCDKKEAANTKTAGSIHFAGKSIEIKNGDGTSCLRLA